jgi:hypothetical protein
MLARLRSESRVDVRTHADVLLPAEINPASSNAHGIGLGRSSLSSRRTPRIDAGESKATVSTLESASQSTARRALASRDVRLCRQQTRSTQGQQTSACAYVVTYAHASIGLFRVWGICKGIWNPMVVRDQGPAFSRRSNLLEERPAAPRSWLSGEDAAAGDEYARGRFRLVQQRCDGALPVCGDRFL